MITLPITADQLCETVAAIAGNARDRGRALARTGWGSDYIAARDREEHGHALLHLLAVGRATPEQIAEAIAYGEDFRIAVISAILACDGAP